LPHGSGQHFSSQLATRLVFASALRAAVPAQKPGSVMRIRPEIWVRFVILPFKGHCWQEFAGAQPAPLAGLPRSFEQIGFVPSPSLRPQLGSFRHFPSQAPRVWRTWPRIRPWLAFWSVLQIGFVSSFCLHSQRPAARKTGSTRRCFITMVLTNCRAASNVRGMMLRLVLLT
jgi:hypothetical protein